MDDNSVLMNKGIRRKKHNIKVEERFVRRSRRRNESAMDLGKLVIKLGNGDDDEKVVLYHENAAPIKMLLFQGDLSNTAEDCLEELAKSYGGEVETCRIECDKKAVFVDKLVRHVLLHLPKLRRLEINSFGLNHTTPSSQDGSASAPMTNGSIEEIRLEDRIEKTFPQWNRTADCIGELLLACPQVKRIECTCVGLCCVFDGKWCAWMEQKEYYAQKFGRQLVGSSQSKHLKTFTCVKCAPAQEYQGQGAPDLIRPGYGLDLEVEYGQRYVQWIQDVRFDYKKRAVIQAPVDEEDEEQQEDDDPNNNSWPGWGTSRLRM